MSELSENAKQVIAEHLPRYPSKQAVTLPALHVVQQERRYVSNKAMEEIAELLELSPAQISDTASFYGFFRTEDNPLGQKRIWVCRSLPCMLRGGEELLAPACVEEIAFGPIHGFLVTWVDKCSEAGSVEVATLD